MKCPRCQFENASETNFCGKCGMPLLSAHQGLFGPTATMQTPLARLERGTVFAGRYEVIEELGKGGMGRVYKAFDKKIKENVALKLLNPEIASDATTLERFNNEVKLARKISHRNVCRVYDLGEEGTTLYITMEFVTGEDLKSFIRRSGHLTEPKAIGIARQICEGLAEAHRLGVLHRDLKPQNIMIDREGNSRIMDFGIARSIHSRGITGSGVMIGTPEYMSPEQTEADEVDQRSDIYSLGIILFEMVTGQTPFSGETPLSVAIKQKIQPPQNPREINPLISESLSRLILKCLEKSRDKRYGSAGALLAELSALEKALPTAERIVSPRKPITTREITVKFSLKKLIVPALVLVAVVAVGLAVKGFLPSKKGAFPAGLMPGRPSVSAARGDRSGSQSPVRGGEEDKRTSAPESKSPQSILGPILKEVGKYIDPKDLDEFEKLTDLLKTKLPAGSLYMSQLNEARDKIHQSRKLRNEGNLEESQKSYVEGESKLSSLMATVVEKDKADAYRAEMEKEKTSAGQAAPNKGENLLFRLAVAKEKDAQAAYGKNDFSGAKTLYQILQVVYAMSTLGEDDAERLVGLQGYIEKLKIDAVTAKAATLASWEYEQAEKEKLRADELAKDDKKMEAAEALIQAAFLYQKSIEKAQGQGQ